MAKTAKAYREKLINERKNAVDIVIVDTSRLVSMAIITNQLTDALAL
jgi:hypothetical protein